jgi:hypothetical protein
MARVSRSIESGLRSISHSQIVNTRHPRRRSACAAFLSRLTVPSILSRQNALRFFGYTAWLHPPWWCQKHPCTKITVLYFGKTMSGQPANAFTCKRNRNPALCRKERTCFSGKVCFPRIRLITQLRLAGENTSVIQHNCKAPPFFGVS